MPHFFYVPIYIVFVIIGFVSVVLIFYPSSGNAVLVCISLLFFSLGILRYEGAIYEWGSQAQRGFYGPSLDLQGVVLSSVSSERSQKVFVQTDHGGALVTVATHPLFGYGDRITMSGLVEDPLAQYPRRESLWVRGAHFTMYFPQIVMKESRADHGLTAHLFLFRDALEDKLKGLYAEPYNALADGMLFGSTNGIDRTIYDSFRRSGTSHILVLSGFNISVVAAFLLFVLQRIFRRSYAIAGAMIGVMLFTIMTGFGAPAVRAAIMSLIALLGYYTGRQYRADIALMWAVFFMLAANPLLLRWDAGFQLSVAATLGIMYVSPWLDSYAAVLLPQKSFRSMVATTIGAQLAVLPFFIWWGVGVSPWSVLANIFIVPLVPFVMALSALAVVFAFISHPLSLLIALPAFLLMKWQIMVASYFGA